MTEAMKNNLFGLLAGDRIITLKHGFGCEIELENRSQTPFKEQLPGKSYPAIIKTVRFYTEKSEKIEEISQTIILIFSFSHFLQKTQTIQEPCAMLNEKISEDYCVNLYDVLLMACSSQGNNNWRNILKEETFPITVDQVLSDLAEARSQDIAGDGIYLHPSILPDFLKDDVV